MDDSFWKEVARLRKDKPTKAGLQSGLANSEFGKRVYQVHLAALNQIAEEEQKVADDLASHRHADSIAATDRGTKWGRWAALLAGLALVAAIFEPAQIQRWLTREPKPHTTLSPVAPTPAVAPSSDKPSTPATEPPPPPAAVADNPKQETKTVSPQPAPQQ